MRDTYRTSVDERLEQIMDRVNRATQWPWRGHNGAVVAPGVPMWEALTARGRFGRATFQAYGGELVCESTQGRDVALIERAPEDLAFLCSLVRDLLDDKGRLEFLLDSRYSCASREEVDHVMATASKPWEPLSIVPASYEIVDERKAGAA